MSRHRAACGDDPTYLDAYAWVAALVVRAVVEADAQDRDSVARGLAALAGHAAVHGLTGDRGFDATGGAPIVGCSTWSRRTGPRSGRCGNSRQRGRFQGQTTYIERPRLKVTA